MLLKKAQLSDQSLVLRAQAGDCRAFNTLVCRYRRRILQLVMRYARNEADAEDLVQDTFIKAYRALPNFRGEAAFYSWLHRIAINASKTALALRARDANFISTDDVDAESLEDFDTPEDLASADEILGVIRAAIAALCAEQRRAIVMCELDGLSYSQVATAMSCPIGTVRSRVFRAREAIRMNMRNMVSAKHAWVANPAI